LLDSLVSGWEGRRKSEVGAAEKGDPLCFAGQFQKQNQHSGGGMTATSTTVKGSFGEYTREELMEMEPIALRGLLHERTHHTIEVPLYPLLLKWQDRAVSGFGEQALLCYEVWHARGFTDRAPDIRWVKKYLAIAEQIRGGKKPKVDEPLPTPFTPEEMAVVNKLICGRRSYRDFLDKPIPESLLETIMEAGRAAPIGCNLGHLKFIVLRTPEEREMIWSDIPTRSCGAIIVIGHDKRVPAIVGQDKTVPQNAGFDAAAAGDHMLLVAHALGLGGCWLSERHGPTDTAKTFKEKYGLPDYIEVDLHIILGYPAMGVIKSSRTPLKDMIMEKSKNKPEEK
jgi:nitroreductase